MTGTFAFLFLIAAILMVWGVVKPQHFAKYARGKTPKRRQVGLLFGTLALASMIISGATPPPTKPATVNLSTTSSTTQSQTTATPKDVVTTKQLIETQAIPFTTTTQNDSTLAKGQTKIAQAGQNGVSTLTYKVTYTGGEETGRTLVSQVTTTPMVPKIVENGTYVAPPVEHPTPQASAPASTDPVGCANGTYVNAAGNTVCRPESAPSAPAGTTAKCRDGTYSFSQTHSGTCSHHGGVAEWL